MAGQTPTDPSAGVFYDKGGRAFDSVTGLERVDLSVDDTAFARAGVPLLTSDTTDVLKNTGLKIVFSPVFADKTITSKIPSVEFKAFVTKFKDNHQTKWDLSDKHAGQGKIIHRQGASGRVLDFSFDVPAHGAREAELNLKNITTLVQMMFPTSTAAAAGYRQANTQKLQWLINYSNLIKDYSCVIESFAVTPNLDVGAFVRSGIIYPKLFSVSISATYQPLINPDFKLVKTSGGLVFHAGAKPMPSYPYGVNSLLASGKPDKKDPPDGQKTKNPAPTTTVDASGRPVDTSLGNSADSSKKDAAQDKPIKVTCPKGTFAIGGGCSQ